MDDKALLEAMRAMMKEELEPMKADIAEIKTDAAHIKKQVDILYDWVDGIDLKVNELKKAN